MSFHPGQIVRFAVPETAAEQSERFEVIEDRGPRVLVRFICGLTLKPTSVYLAADLTAAPE